LKNKAAILIGVLSEPALIAAGRVRPEGDPVAPESQTAEAVHAQLNRRMDGGVQTLTRVVQTLMCYLSYEHNESGTHISHTLIT
jgi:hypothetical protein